MSSALKRRLLGIAETYVAEEKRKQATAIAQDDRAGSPWRANSAAAALPKVQHPVLKTRREFRRSDFFKQHIRGAQHALQRRTDRVDARRMYDEDLEPFRGGLRRKLSTDGRKLFNRLQWRLNTPDEPRKHRKDPTARHAASISSAIGPHNALKSEKRAIAQPFVALVPDAQKSAALMNAAHNIWEGRVRCNGEDPESYCCLEGLAIACSRSANICFSCGARKRLDLLMCWKCWQVFHSRGFDSMLEWLAVARRTSSAGLSNPDNCRYHRLLANEKTIVMNGVERCTKLHPRLGLTTSTAAALIAAVPPVSSTPQMLGNVVHVLGGDVSNTSVTSTLQVLLQKHTHQLMWLPGDRPAALRTLQEAWCLIIGLGSRSQLLKTKTPSIIRKERFMRRTLAKIRNRLASSSLESWKHFVSVVKSNRSKVAGSLAKIFNRLLNAAYQSWRIYTIRRVRARDLARRVVARQLGMLKLLTFERWNEWTIETIEEREKKIMHMLAKWRLAPAAACLRAWCDRVALMRRVRAFAQKMRLRPALMAIRSWEFFVEHNKHMRSFMAQQIKRMKFRLEARCFDSWVEGVDAILEMKEQKIRQVLHRIQTRWQRQFMTNLKVQTSQTISARRLQCLARRVAGWQVREKLRAEFAKREQSRLQRRQEYADEAVARSMKMARHRLRSTLWGRMQLNNLIQRVRAVRQAGEDLDRIKNQIDDDEASKQLSLFAPTHLKYVQTTLNEEEKELWEEEWTAQQKLEKCRSVFAITVRPKINAVLEYERRFAEFQAAWRAVDPSGRKRKLDVALVPNILRSLGLSCVVKDGYKKLVQSAGKNGRKVSAGKTEAKTVSKRELQDWILSGGHKGSGGPLQHLTSLAAAENWIIEKAGVSARQEAMRSIEAAVVEEAEQLAIWYFDECCPSEFVLRCTLCSRELTAFTAWRRHRTTCVGRTQEHLREKLKSIAFHFAQDLVHRHPQILSATLCPIRIPEEVAESSAPMAPASPQVEEMQGRKGKMMKTVHYGDGKEDTYNEASETGLQDQNQDEIADVDFDDASRDREDEEYSASRGPVVIGGIDSEDVRSEFWKDTVMIDEEIELWRRHQEDLRLERIASRKLRRKFRSERRFDRKMARWKKLKDKKEADKNRRAEVARLASLRRSALLEKSMPGQSDAAQTTHD